MTTATIAPWQAQIIQQLEQLTADELTGKTHAIIWTHDDGPATLLHLASSEAEALVQAEDEAAKVPAGGEVTTATLASIQDWMAAHTDELLPVATGHEPDSLEQELSTDGVDVRITGPDGTTGAQAVTAAVVRTVEGTTEPADPDKGRLFDVKVQLDPTRPTVLKLAFSGGLELDLDNPDDVAFYNRLTAGKNANLEITAHVATVKKTHRRDSEGYVDAVVETKSLTVHTIDTN